MREIEREEKVKQLKKKKKIDYGEMDGIFDKCK